MMQTNQTVPVITVNRSRLRSTTEEPPKFDEKPPPNMSDRPPPLPLWSRTSRIMRQLARMRAMEIPISTVCLVLQCSVTRDDSNLLLEGTACCQVAPPERLS